MAEISMESFATADELAETWRALTATEESRAGAILAQASNYLRQIAANNGVDLDDKIQYAGPVYLANVKMVILNATQRAMTAPSEMFPDASQFSMSATPYSESMSVQSGSSTQIYFKQKELDLLGLGNVSGHHSVGILRGVRG